MYHLSMRFQVPCLLVDQISDVIYLLLGVTAALVLTSICRSSGSPNLDKIPTVGSSAWLGPWWAGIKFLINAPDVVQEGYNRYKGASFKVPTLYYWMVVFTSRQHAEEFRKFRDEELSFLEAASDILQAEHTLGRDTHYDPYHIVIVRSRLNRNLGALYADVKDEIVCAVDDILNLECHEWKSIPAVKTFEQVVSRASNRAFVGPSLCRDPDWVDLTIRFTTDVVQGAAIINLFPKFMAPLVAQFLTRVPACIRRGIKHLSPIVEAHRNRTAEGGIPSDDNPNDLVSWLMEGSAGSQRNVSNITSRILAVNFAAIHTSSTSFVHALYNLAANPQYIQPLRDEVESIIQEEGWSNAAVTKMHKIDSFMKESQRMNGIGLVNMVRKAVKDVTFSDGTVIPKGTFVVMATQQIHNDNEFYEDAEKFVPFRFADMRASDSANTKYLFPTTSPDYLVFGYGRHACPGRFFAASLVNTMLAYLVVSYDIKLEDNATRPRNWRLGTLVTVNPTARVMLRRRVV